VTIAVPTEATDVALAFLERGISVLVEKPMTRTLAEADALIAAAAASGATLAVGHTERYNPAVAAVMPFVTTPRFIEVHRLGAFPDRSLDIDVVFDLMIHDLDIILALVKAEPTSIEAVGVPVLDRQVRHRQRAPALLERLHRERDRQPDQQERVRKIRFFQPDAYVSIDYARAGGRGLPPEAPRGAAARDPGGQAAGHSRGAAQARADGLRPRRDRQARAARRRRRRPRALRWRRRLLTRWRRVNGGESSRTLNVCVIS
jgi:hypothetical protein